MLRNLLTLDLDANVSAIKNIAMLISENTDKNFFFFNMWSSIDVLCQNQYEQY